MLKEMTVLIEGCQLINSWCELLSVFLKDSRSIGYEYCRLKEDNAKNEFNVFRLISDVYYKENFHSDIIRFLLDPRETHRGGSKYLEVFIQMLNNKGRRIDPSAYHDAVVVREKGRIDLLIKSESNKRAIIIENKMNNAGDRLRQLPRYYDYAISNHYCVDAIVYIPCEMKNPDKEGWTSKDIEEVESLLVTIPAYDKSGERNLVDDWLRPSIRLSDSPDVVSTLRQYVQLIIQINQRIMDAEVFEKFYNILIQNDNLQTAQSIRCMLNELPEYLAKRIYDKYRIDKKYEPFTKVDRWNAHHCTYFDKAKIGDRSISIDIYCSDTCYDLRLFVRNTALSEYDYDRIIQKMPLLSMFDKYHEDNVGFRGVCYYGFQEEDKLFDYLDRLLKELRTLKE